jgi:hypothetical protein
LSVDDLEETLLDAPDDAVPADVLRRVSGALAELPDPSDVSGDLAAGGDEGCVISHR